VSDPFPPSADLGPAPASPFGDGPDRHGIVVPRWIVVVVVLAVVFGGGIAIGRWAIGSRSTTTSSSVTPTTTAQAPPSSDTDALSHVILQQSDVGSNLTVVLLPNGDQVQGQPTLDLCNGTYATESLRAARLQDVAQDTNGTTVFSTEAVVYANAADSARAFSELKTVAAKCPHNPVVSPVGEPTVTTHFDAAPDARWPAPPAGVNRLAFSFTVTDQQGHAIPSLAVYLRRGPALIGVYFSQPNVTQPAIAGQTSIPGIVNVFATRLAQLPQSTVNRG